MKTVFSLVSLLVVALSHPAWARGGGGGGGFGGGAHFGGGGGGGGGHFGGGGGFHSAPAFHGGGFGGLRYSFGARPTYGRPVSVRPQGQVARATTDAPLFRQPRSSVSASGNRTARTEPTARSIAPNSAARPSDNARNHIFAREDGSRHRVWGPPRRSLLERPLVGLGWRLLDRSRRRLLSLGLLPLLRLRLRSTRITTLVTTRTLSPTTIPKAFTTTFPQLTQT